MDFYGFQWSGVISPEPDPLSSPLSLTISLSNTTVSEKATLNHGVLDPQLTEGEEEAGIKRRIILKKKKTATPYSLRSGKGGGD